MNLVERADFTNADLQQIFRESESYALRSVGAFKDQVLENLANPPEMRGFTLPWSKTHDLFRMRRGEVSIWAGINGHRKSTLLNMVALWASQETRVGIASFEMPVNGLVELMVRQGSGNKQPSPEWAGAFMDWLDQRVWFYDVLGSVPPIQGLGGVAALADKGCGLICLDSLQMMRVSDDMERERLFMAELTSLAEALDVHVALVHHVRKPQSGGDEYIPTRFDVKGNGAITDLCQNLLLCWANKKKAGLERAQEMGATLTDKELETLQEPDQRLIVAKQRHGEFEGSIALWHHESRQFTGSKDRRSTHIKFGVKQ